jgi:hypothetical protein
MRDDRMILTMERHEPKAANTASRSYGRHFFLRRYTWFTFVVTSSIHSRLPSTMVKLYIAIRQDSPNFKLPHYHEVVDVQNLGKPVFAERKLGWNYQTLTAKNEKGGPGLEILVESLANLAPDPVKLITIGTIRRALDTIGEQVDKLIKDARAEGHGYEHVWRRIEHSTSDPLYPWGFGAFPERSAVVRVSFICVQERDQIWGTVHEWALDD